MSKKIILGLTIIFLAASISFSQEHKESDLITIEIPVRVFDGNQFVDNLTMDDFEIYENGVLQNPKALYLTEKAQIIRKDIKQEIKPDLGRQFCFLFQMTEYSPRIREGMSYFFNNIFRPEDRILLVTPLKQYNLSPKAIDIKSREDLVKDITKVIRKDTQFGSTEYNSAIIDLKRIVSTLSSMSGGQQSTYQTSIDTTSADSSGPSDLIHLLPNYRETLEKLETMRIVDERNFISFASHLKTLPGQKIVFLFYQREFRPELNSSTMNRLVSNNQSNPGILNQLQDLFQVYYREVNINIDRLKKIFADSSAMMNLMFFNKNPEDVPGVVMREQSEDLYEIFSELAQSTGGIVTSAQNPDAALKDASNVADKCYLLYYSPNQSTSDDQFKNIELKIKDKNYKVFHREGYFQVQAK